MVSAVPETSSTGKGTHEDIFPGLFSYALYTDDAWFDWQYEISQNLSKASQAQKDARLRFSDYAIEVTGSDSTGICLQDLENGNGGWCLLKDGPTEIATYRMTFSQLEGYVKNTASLDLATVKVEESDTNLLYMDVFKCTGTSPFTCQVFQPDWFPLNENTSQGYPRFGAGGLAKAYTLPTNAAGQEIVLMGATALSMPLLLLVLIGYNM